MQALMSPHSATALLFQQQSTLLLVKGQTPQALSPAEVTEWVATHDELRWRSADCVAEATRALFLYSCRQEALDLALICLDGDLSGELRDEAQQELETLLSDSCVFEWLADLFHARPLPAVAAFGAALDRARAAQRQRLLSWLEPVVKRQEAIANSWAAWCAVPEDLFQRAGGRQMLMESGLSFARVIEPLAEGKSEDAKFAALLEFAKWPGYRQIVEAWFIPLSTIERAARILPAVPGTEEFEEAEVSKQSVAAQHRSYDREKVRRNVEKQKAQIVRLMRSRSWARIFRLVEELLGYQHRYGGGSYAAKSLCDLATEAKAFGLHQFQLDLTTRAIELNPEDGWAWAQHGDALLHNGRLQEALTAYESSVGFGTYRVGRNGRAEVLKALGRYQDALDAYDAVIEAHPQDVIAKNGRAEVLKVTGKLTEAAAAYAAIRDKHPEDLVARNGYASVLAMLGEHQAALDLLPAVKPELFQDWVGWHIRGMVLIRSGRLEDAVQVLQLGAEHCPPLCKDYFHTALALAKLWREDWKGAQEQLVQVTTPRMQRAGNVVWLHIRAAQNDREGMQQAIAELAGDNPPTLIVELTAELRLRFLEKGQGAHSTQWLREREIDCLALAA